MSNVMGKRAVCIGWTTSIHHKHIAYLICMLAREVSDLYSRISHRLVVIFIHS